MTHATRTDTTATESGRAGSRALLEASAAALGERMVSLHGYGNVVASADLGRLDAAAAVRGRRIAFALGTGAVAALGLHALIPVWGPAIALAPALACAVRAWTDLRAIRAAAAAWRRALEQTRACLCAITESSLLLAEPGPDGFGVRRAPLASIGAAHVEAGAVVVRGPTGERLASLPGADRPGPLVDAIAAALRHSR